MVCIRQLSVCKKYQYLYDECKGHSPLTVGRPTKCDAKRVRADRLDEVVWQALCQLLRHPHVSPPLHQAWAAAKQQNLSALEAQQSQLFQRQQRIECQDQRLLDTYQAEVLNLSELQTRRQKRSAELQQIEQERRQLAQTRQQSIHGQPVIDHAETFRQLLGHNLEQLSFEECQAIAQCLISKVVVTGEAVDIHYVLPFESTPRVAQQPTKAPEGAPGQFYRLRLADFHLPALAVELGEVGDTVDLCLEPRRHEGHLMAPEPRRADVVAHLSEYQRIWQGRQGLPGKPRGTGLRFQPHDKLVMDASRFEPAGSWHAFDGRRPPHTWSDKGPPGREIDTLSRTDAQHRMHASLDKEGQMGIRTQAAIGHQHIPLL
jgi:hypothetical protein